MFFYVLSHHPYIIRTVAISLVSFHSTITRGVAYFCTALYHPLTNFFCSRSLSLSYRLYTTVFIRNSAACSPARLALHVYYSLMMYLIILPVLIPKYDSHSLP